MKIVVVGLGYVGLSNAVLLAQHNEVVGVDIDERRISLLKSGNSPIEDPELLSYLIEKPLKLELTTQLADALVGAHYVVVATPTNYDEKNNYFDTSTVEEIVRKVSALEPKACIVVRSTVPVGFIDEVRLRLDINSVIFAPEFLREGRALYDNLYPSRIVVGEKSNRAKIFAELLKQSALEHNVEIKLTGAREAEAIKLFSNTFLAMRVAFFNELDSYALGRDMDPKQIIEGICLDKRIGNYYNNPSFGYGGYCLPKDTKQLLANYSDIPQNLIRAIVDANLTRKIFIAEQIAQMKPNVVGIYRLVMKANSDNYRKSAIFDIIQILKEKGIDVMVYEPTVKMPSILGLRIESNLLSFKKDADIILANRLHQELDDVFEKIFSRDIYSTD